MAHLDVHRRRDGGVGYLLNVQSDLIFGLDTRLAVPLLPEGIEPIAAARLNPVFEIEGERLAMMTQFAAAVHLRELGERIANLANAHEKVIGALDLLLAGA